MQLRNTNKKDLPLHGRRVLVTRSSQQAASFTQRLSNLGADVIELPVIEFEPPDSWLELDEAIASIDKYDWVIFASENGVKSFYDRLTLNPASQLKIQREDGQQTKPKFAAIGDNTAAVAESLHLKIDYKPDAFVAEAFVETFPDYPQLRGLTVLWPRTNIGRQYIFDKLSAAGAQVTMVSAYKTCMPDNSGELSNKLYQLLKNKELDVITLASRQTVVNLNSMLESALSTSGLTKKALKDKVLNLLDYVAIISIGPQTTEEAVNLFNRIDGQAKHHNFDGLTQAILQHFAIAVPKT